jgi:hypothetical protein
MLVTLGARIQADDLLDLLAACHGRIRHHLTLARRLAHTGASSNELRDTAMQIRRYFSIGLPDHVADEDLVIATRVRCLDTMAILHAQHIEHAPWIDKLVAACAAVEREAKVPPELREICDVLEPMLAEHLALEERVMFAELRAMPAAERARLAAAIRERREEARRGS